MISDKLVQLIQNGNDGFPLTDAYKVKHRYYTDFIKMMNYFSENLSEKEYRDVERKFIGESKIGEQPYLQTVSELTVLYYVIRNFNSKFKYEPKYNGNFNPECSFIAQDIIVNVEVKCPNMLKRMEIEQHSTLKLNIAERIPDFENVILDLKRKIETQLSDTQYSGLEFVPRMDLKLKDYLLSAQDKFPNEDKYFNVLVIALDILADLDEWYNYIFDSNGVFTNNSFVQESYENVDSILLSTPVCGHRNWKNIDKVNVWELEQTVNLLLLNPRRENSRKGDFYFSDGLFLFGDLTSAFLNYQKYLDADGTVSTDDENFREKYLKFKTTEIRMVSNFFEFLREHK